MRQLTTVFLAILICAAAAAAGEPEEPVWEFKSEAANGEIEVTALLDAVTAETGARFVFDPMHPGIRNRRIHLRGTARIPKSKVFAWAEALLYHHRLVLVPGASGGGFFWKVMDGNDSGVTDSPVYVPASLIDRCADREGLYVMTVVPLRYLRDTTRARNCLSLLSTRMWGRVSEVLAMEFLPPARGRPKLEDIPGARAIVIADYAPVAAAQVALLLEIETAASRDELRLARERLAGADDVRDRAAIEEEIAAIEAYLAGPKPDRSTPEGAVEAWRKAIREHDTGAWLDLLEPGMVKRMEEDHRELKGSPQFAEFAAKAGIPPERLAKMSHREFLEAMQAFPGQRWFAMRRATDFSVLGIGPVVGDSVKVTVRSGGKESKVTFVRRNGLWYFSFGEGSR